MRFLLRSRLQRRCILVFVTLALGLGSLPAATWTNRDGQRIEASVLGYDIETHEVHFAYGTDGETFRYPLRDLDWQSRLRAVFSPASLASLNEAGWRPEPAYFLRLALAWVLALLVFSLVVSFGGFWTAARLVSGEPGFFYHLSGFLKYVFANSVIALVSYTLVILAALNHFSGVASDAASAQDALATLSSSTSLPGRGWLLLFQLVVWAILIFVIGSHYQLGFFRSLLILFLNGFFGLLIAAALLLGLGTLAVRLFRRPDLLDHVVNGWLLEPLGLL